MKFDPKGHWEKVYQEKKLDKVSWFKANPELSLELIALTKIDTDKKIIDIGGGASILVDRLIEKKFTDLTVLDISATAIQYANERLQKRARKVKWIEANITEFKPPELYDLWHDWAVFHFFTNPDDRRKYVETLNKAVRPDGFVIIATFSLTGPQKCSGLNVERYDAEKLSKELGSHFTLLKNIEETHLTPWLLE